MDAPRRLSTWAVSSPGPIDLRLWQALQGLKAFLNELVGREDGGAFCLLRTRVVALICWLKQAHHEMEELRESLGA